jgi:GtrA-like protein
VLEADAGASDVRPGDVLLIRMPGGAPSNLSLHVAMRSDTVTARASALSDAAGDALRRPANWVQLAKFCLVGASGYVVNLAVFAALLHGAGLHYVPAAVCSFLVAVTNNYM